MNLADLKAFISHNMLQIVEAFPAVFPDYRAYQVVAYIKTPDPKVLLPLTYTTDRPFADQAEITAFFNRVGLPKHKLHFVFPNSVYYQSAETA